MIRAAAAALIGALASAVWLALFYAANGGLRVEFAVDPPRVVTGFYPSEHDTATGLTFAWTGSESGLRLPGLDRRRPWTLTIRARGGRPAGGENPLLSFFVDGVQLHTAQVETDFTRISVLIPPRPDRRGLTVSIRSSSTFVPGADDTRRLGFMVDALELTPNGVVLPPTDILVTAMLSGAALAGAIALLGITSGAAVGAAVLLSAGQGAVLAHGFAPYSVFPQVAARVAWSIAIVLAATAWLLRWRSQPIRNTARFAVAFSAGACFLKLLVLLHPNMPIGDALFQAHRFIAVLNGDLYFTSIAPGGYAFPYAPGLYVVASPFADLVRREMGDMDLLRIVTTVANTAVGLLLYLMSARAWNDRLAAAMSVAFYHLMPLGFRIITVGNLTNAFAESLSVVVLALITSPVLRGLTNGMTIALVLMLTAAFLSHTSTFAILSICALTTAAIFAWKGGPALRMPAAAIALALVAAIGLAIAVYYAHFGETYRTELSRLGGETATAAPDAGGRGTLQRAAAVPRYLYLYFSVPILALAITGAVDRWRRRIHDRLALAISGWICTCLLFLAIGVLTPLDMRYYLSAIPAIAVLAGAGAAWGWGEGRVARVATAVLLAWTIWIGVETWWSTLA